MRPGGQGREREESGWFQIPAWIHKWLMLSSTEIEMKQVRLGRARTVMGIGGNELKSGSLKCLWIINLELSSRLSGLGTQALKTSVGEVLLWLSGNESD